MLKGHTLSFWQLDILLDWHFEIKAFAGNVDRAPEGFIVTLLLNIAIGSSIGHLVRSMKKGKNQECLQGMHVFD